MSKPPLHLIKVLPPENGSSLGFTVEVTPEFESWFIKDRNIPSWNDEIFNKWFKGFVLEAIRVKAEEQGRRRTEQQRVDIWSRDSLDE